LIIIVMWLLAAGAQQALAAPANPPQAAREIQVTTEIAPDGATVLNVVAKGVTLRKLFYVGHTELAVAAAGHELKIVVSTGGIQAYSDTGRATFPRRGNVDSLDSVRAVLGGSPIVPIARALARAAAVGNPRAADTLRMSEALLGLLSGDPRALDSVVAASRAPVLRNAQTTNQCWDSYRRDVSVISVEYEDCVRRTRWYEAGTRLGCGLEYTVRAELAFSWLIACNGGFMGG
jgi:hypothetical protein